jgi:hypothetical protein
MAGVYAEGTKVPVSQSTAEIQRTLERYGAAEFGYMSGEGGALVLFSMHGKRFRFRVPLPRPDDPHVKMTPANRVRTDAARRDFIAAETRRLWRSLLLVLKAKLEAVDSGIVTFEEEFAMHALLPDGRTAADHVVPFIEESYRVGSVPSLLAIGGGPS